jgi:hypothetical protein
VAERSRREAPEIPPSVRHARLVAEREALAAVVPTDPGPDYYALQNQVRRLESALGDLDRADGMGVWRGTPVGDAARGFSQAHREWMRCSAEATHAGWRQRHRLLCQADRAGERVRPLKEAFERLAAPERARLEAELPDAKKLLADLEGRYYGHLHFEIAHPEALTRLERLDSQIFSVAREVDIERQGIDGIAGIPPPAQKHDWEIERDAPGLERDIELGIGL